MPFVARPPLRRFRGRVAREGAALSLSSHWRAWVAENLLLGVDRGDLLATLVENGVPERVASREIEGIRGSPMMQGANRVARRVRRHEVVVRMKRTMDKLASSPTAVERRSKVSRDELFDRYYAASLPLVVTDALEPWPKVRDWSPSQWRARFGHVEIEATTGREADPIFEPNFKAHCTTTRLDAFCDRVLEAGTTNDLYMIANNHLAKRPGLEPLLDDVRAPHEYLDERRTGDCVSLWFGPGGTLTPLHHDTANVFFCQAFGRKKVILFPAFELFLTHDAHHGVHSPIDPENPDLDAFPELRDAIRKEVVLSPGEGLFIPLGWWHHVRALDVSISVSFTNFRKPNHFTWYYPGLVK
jgi:hypothetical protein